MEPNRQIEENLLPEATVSVGLINTVVFLWLAYESQDGIVVRVG